MVGGVDDGDPVSKAVITMIITPSLQPLLQDLSETETDGDPADSFHYCPPGLTQDVRGCRLVWRILTWVLCIPLCYPCYLTKHARWVLLSTTINHNTTITLSMIYNDINMMIDRLSLNSN